MEKLIELLKKMELNIDTGFGVITLQYRIPLHTGNYTDETLIDLYKLLLELKNS